MMLRMKASIHFETSVGVYSRQCVTFQKICIFINTALLRYQHIFLLINVRVPLRVEVPVNLCVQLQ